MPKIYEIYRKIGKLMEGKELAHMLGDEDCILPFTNEEIMAARKRKAELIKQGF